MSSLFRPHETSPFQVVRLHTEGVDFQTLNPKPNPKGLCLSGCLLLKFLQLWGCGALGLGFSSGDPETYGLGFRVLGAYSNNSIISRETL